MKLYLTPKPSLDLIRYLRSTNGKDGIGGAPVRRKSLSDAINSVRLVNELDETAQRWLDHIDDPIHAYVAEKAKGTSTKHLVTHILNKPVPNGAFLDLGHDVCICTPQFAFLGIAATSDLIDTTLVGMELCGYYSRWRLDPKPLGSAIAQTPIDTKNYEFELPPAMRIKRLQAFIDRQDGRRGVVNARMVLQWMASCSASPMETIVYLLLCLPKRLGGYGLPKPVLNPKLIVSTPGGTKDRYPDLFWPGANIDVEYNSDVEHGGEWARYRDSKREVELVVAKVKVLPLTRPQVIHADEFDEFAQGLRRLLGLRSRRPDATWRFRNHELKTRLISTMLGRR